MKKLAYIIFTIPLIMASCSIDPVADFFVSRNVIDAGETVYFTNNSFDADYFEWDFGDGTRSNAYDPSHLYLEEGVYTVTLFAYRGNHKVDKSIQTITVRYPTTLEIIVLEYYDEYPVADASVILYGTLADWEYEENYIDEQFTNDYGEAVFTYLYPQRYYLDVWEQNHHNYWLAEEDVAWIETHLLEPNELNTFFAYVDYTGSNLKSSAERNRNIPRVMKLEKVEPRKYQEKLESIKRMTEERKTKAEISKKNK